MTLDPATSSLIMSSWMPDVLSNLGVGDVFKTTHIPAMRGKSLKVFSVTKDTYWVVYNDHDSAGMAFDPSTKVLIPAASVVQLPSSSYDE